MVDRLSRPRRENPATPIPGGTDRSVLASAPPRRGHADSVIAELAAAHHGVVTRRQILDQDIPGHVITHRLGHGSLRPIHRGVYRVGPIPGPRWREMAAVLACGEHALVSHGTAAAMWELIPWAPGPPDVTIWEGCRARPGIRVHRTLDLPADERTALGGVPVTTPGRTLLDLAAVSEGRALERSLARAERRGLASADELERLLHRHPGRPGVQALRTILGRARGPVLTRSEAEDRFLALVRAAQLDPPEVNVVVCGVEVDFLWREARLVVEVDGFAYHSSLRAFEADRRRDALLAGAGYRAFRVTWRRLTREPEALVAGLATALARAPGLP